MELTHAVDVTDVQGGAGDFSPIPAGVYMAQIIAAEEKKTQDLSGYYLNITFSIIGEKYAGRRVWGNITTVSSDAQKLGTGHRHLANLLDAAGLPRKISNTDVLLQKVVPIKVIIQKADEKRPKDSNFVSEFGLGADPKFRPGQGYAASSVVDYGISGTPDSPQGLKKPPIGF